MAIAFVQKATANIEGIDNGTVGLTGVVAGNLLILTIQYYSGDDTSGTTVTDSNGGAMTAAHKIRGDDGGNGDTSGLGAAVYFIPNCAAGAHTVTIDMNLSSAFSCYYRATLAEFSGMATASPLDIHIGTSGHVAGTQTASPGTSGATAQADELAVAVCSVQGNVANMAITSPATTGYTSLDVNHANNFSVGMGGQASYKILSSTGTQTAGWTWTDAATERWAATLVTFKAPAGAAPPQTGALAISGKQPVVTQQWTIVPATGALSLSGKQPALGTQGVIQPTSGAMAFTGNQPIVQVSGAVVITPSTGAITFTGLQPQETLSVPAPQTGAAAFTGNAPLILQGSGRTPTVATITITGLQPVVTQQLFIVPSTGALNFAGLQPTVNNPGGGNTTIIPSSGALNLVGTQPTVQITLFSPVTITPSTGALTWTGITALVTQPSLVGNLATFFVNDATPVPATARYIGGAAFKPTGERYVAYWPANNKVVFLAGFAHREDGALIIDPIGVMTGKIQGVALTFRGEVVTTLNSKDLDHNNWPMKQAGTVCVTAQS